MYRVKIMLLCAALVLAGCFDEQSNPSEKIIIAKPMADAPPMKTESDKQFPPNVDLVKPTESSLLPLRGKPGAQVALANLEEYRLQPDAVTDIELMLVTMPTRGRMQVVVSASDGLELLSPTTLFEFTLDMDAGEYRIPLRLRAVNNGRYYVHLHIDIESDNRTMARAVSAIVQVGAEESTQRAASTASRNKRRDAPAVIELPATEIIIRE